MESLHDDDGIFGDHSLHQLWPGFAPPAAPPASDDEVVVDRLVQVLFAPAAPLSERLRRVRRLLADGPAAGLQGAGGRGGFAGGFPHQALPGAAAASMPLAPAPPPFYDPAFEAAAMMDAGAAAPAGDGPPARMDGVASDRDFLLGPGGTARRERFGVSGRFPSRVLTRSDLLLSCSGRWP
jgi:hypothetical protein